jgi:hypothetical protein
MDHRGLSFVPTAGNRLHWPSATRQWTSNGRFDAQSGVYKLPVELLLFIFQQCDSAIRPRLVLTHTCRRWRLIATSYPSLWTNLHIGTHIISTATRYNHFESLLSTQVDRSGRLPLDIVWSLDILDLYATHVLRVIRDKAPFPRWRSLELQMGGRDWGLEGFLASIMAFPNLESLVIFGCVDPSIARIFGRAMPKLQMLDLRAGDDLGWEDRVIGTLTQGPLSLRASISTLCAGIREMHPFPNILNYKLKACIFKANALIDLRRMTSLIIDDTLYIFEDCDVLLPALQYLRLMDMSIALGSKIEAPVLQTLHLSATPDRHDPLYARYTIYDNMIHAVDNPGYLLSPKGLIIQEPYLSNETIIGLLKKSRKLTQATLCFTDQNSAQEVVETLFKSSTGSTPLGECLCPHLAELTLDWWGADMPFSAEWWLSGLEGRKKNPQRPRVLIKARRRGEEWYRLLGEW